ncbi:MAG: hypothetical protein AAFS05_12650 [Pseudomonadota bacterium]
MSHHPTLYQRLDDIDRLVEEVAQNPERADTVKDALRARLAGANVHPMTPMRPTLEATDPDDYWDNVPI